MPGHTQWSGSNDWTARGWWSGAKNGRSSGKWVSYVPDSMEDSRKDHVIENSADDQTFESEFVSTGYVSTAASSGEGPVAWRGRHKGIRQPADPDVKRALVPLSRVPRAVPSLVPEDRPPFEVMVQSQTIGIEAAAGIPPPPPDAPPICTSAEATLNDRPKVEAPVPPPPVRWTTDTLFAVGAPRAPPPTPLLVNQKMDHFVGAMAYFGPRNMVGALTKALNSSAASLEIGSVGPPPLRLSVSSEPMDGSQDYSPEQFLQDWIGLKEHMRQRYLAIHGSCSATSRFGAHVHAGLIAMARQHRPHETNVKAVWILYGTHMSFNKAQQKKPYGTHELDGEQCMWFPGTGIYCQKEKGWKCRCIGQEWFGEPARYIDESRVQVCEWTNNDSYSSDVAEIDPPWGDMIVPGLSTQNIWKTAGP